MSESFYPESPAVDKAEFTKITSSYRTQIILNLIAIILFFVLFVLMIVGAALLLEAAITYPLSYDYTKWELLLKVGVIAMSAMLLLFLLKFLFKRHNTNNPMNVEITEAEHPKLFEFIRTLSQEVGAPFPKKIFVNHEINASVFYNSTILSLFFPVKKNLLIGLGLVNSINLSEFKAVLAHEFGHFAQSSMKLGSYVYMANRIIYDMVYERDRWDDLLDRWKETDIRLSIFAWLLSPIIWLVRLFLNLLFNGLNAMHSALSRQMEYNADLVAVSVTGSNQIINALYKMGLTSQSYDLTLSKLADARNHDLFSEDLFYNHTASHQHLMATNKAFGKEALTNKVPDLTAQYNLYEKDDDSSTLQMYASHPSNFKREKNAKKTFVEGPNDERSPWILFGDDSDIAQRVTKKLYEVSLGQTDLEYKTKEEIQNFIIEELTEADFDERYHGYFQSRNLELKELKEFTPKTDTNAASQLEEIQALWSDETKSKMETVEQKRSKMNEVLSVLQQASNQKTIEVNDKTYKAKDAMQAYHAVVKLMEADGEWFREMDRRIYESYMAASMLLNSGQEELEERYAFLKTIDEHEVKIHEMRGKLNEYTEEVAELTQADEDDIKLKAQKFHAVRTELDQLMLEAKNIPLPELKNIGTAKNLEAFCLSEPVAFVSVTSLNFEFIQNLAGQMDDIINRLGRLYTKNLGAILKLQEDLEKQLAGRAS